VPGIAPGLGGTEKKTKEKINRAARSIRDLSPAMQTARQQLEQPD
jgi:hypothetical protein